MEYCVYHPLTGATYACPGCEQGLCDSCVDNDEHCLLCGQPTESLGAGHQIEPFWRRLQAAFRYPLTQSTVALIIVISVVSALLSILPMIASVILYLVTTGVIMKYAFLALEQTATGKMTPPDITEAYQGGIGLLVQLVLMLVVLVGSVIGVGYLVSPQIAAFLAFFYLFGLPAMLISYGLNQNWLAAINPVSTFRLIAAIGLPYGILIGLLMVMTGSVTVLHQLIGEDWLVVSYILQSMASNYYLIVIFHLMGYVIFQYQGKLGFTAREDDGNDDRRRTDEALAVSRIDVFLKAGRYDKAYRQFEEAIHRFHGNKSFRPQYFECVYQLGDVPQMAAIATPYLCYLLAQGQEARLMPVFNQVRSLVPDFVPDDARLRHTLARAANEQGNPRLAIQLINGMQRSHPNYEELPEAFRLMADLLARQPGREAQARQCRDLAEKLALRLESREDSAAKRKPPPRPDPFSVLS